MATFGKTDTTGTTTGAVGGNYQFGNQAVLAENALVTSLSWYLDGAGGSVGTQYFRFLIYTDDGLTPPRPLNLLAQTVAGSITNGDAAGWRTLNLTSPLSLAPGTYWLTLQPSTPDTVLRCYRDLTTPGNGVYNIPDMYSDGPLATLSGGTTGTARTYAAYATYTPAGAPRQSVYLYRRMAG